ncbi:TPA: DGQHR domain-containing protein DpdB [Vibrio diabolicus]|uniref:DGQHR domain-containing protein DpdB n=1 Tax=Vibrio sp. D3 TaxID=3374281 RepID=UPI003757DD3A
MKKKALKIQQSNNVQLFQFNMNLDELESVSMITRIERKQKVLEGYQRPEVRNHINNIADYLGSEDGIIPNSIIMSLSSDVELQQIDGEIFDLIIPDVPKSALIVDGQQRLAALRLADRRDFYLPVCAFINDNQDFERQQFLLINSAKPLPKSLIYELLPHANGVFNQELTRRKLPSLLVQILNFDESSPLFGLVKLVTNPLGVIADNSLMKMLDNSLREGALYAFRNQAQESYSPEDCGIMTSLLNDYFLAVKEAFPDDWGKKPKESRLFHGAGILALGQLFDEMFYSYEVDGKQGSFFDFAKKRLVRLKPFCRWSGGSWDFGADIEGQPITRKWNQIQNLSQDINLITDYLTRIYDLQEREVTLVKSQ